MTTCGACGAGNPAEDLFCGDCGAPLLAACPACGQPVAAGRRFCGKCGQPIEVGAAAPATRGAGGEVPAAGGRERRRVSVLFCDLVGYTGLADGRDPEETRELLSGYFDLARSIVDRYGGAVEKFIGDAVMAVWGAPVAHEDDAERAVRAALELVDAVPAYGAAAGVELGARVGVASGSAATVEAHDEGLVVGDRVNLAARVQAAALPGSCYVDEATRRLASRAILFEDAGAHQLKGVAEPAQLYRAARVVTGVGGRQRSGAREAPFVGREMELRSLKELFHATAERRSPRLVVVAGPAGVGKSRLGWEFEKYVDGLVDTVLWHRGRCLSYGEGVTFWALAEMVRQRLSIAEDDPREVAAAKLAEGLVRLVPESEREYVGARVARLLGVEGPEAREVPLAREELFAGWRLLFERLAGVAPVVLLVEDAQHADSGLLDFLDHLVDWTRQLPILVVVLTRPELADAYPGFGVGRNRSVLSLDPLDAPSMDRLVEELLPGLPASSRAQITARAEGIPLFAVETVRSLLDSGVLTSDGEGAYRLAGELGTFQVPDTLQALLAARLDSLGSTEREFVGMAAVLGSSFPAEALVSISGRGADEVRAALGELVRRDVLEVTADPLSPQQGDYRFAQELLRQVAYETLSRRERKQRHLAVAAHLRATFSDDGEEVAEVVARHYLDALEAAGADPDVPELRAQALVMLERAGRRAEATGAPARAAVSYAAAAKLEDGDGAGGDAARAAALLEQAASAATLAGRLDVALDHAAAAYDRYMRAGDERRAARTRVLAGTALARADRDGEARAELRGALSVLEDEPDAATVEALAGLANVEAFSGNLEEADRLGRRALSLGQALVVGDGPLGRLLMLRGVFHGMRTETAEATAYLREAAQLAERAGATADLSRVLLNLSDVQAGFDPRSSAEVARVALEHARRVGAADAMNFATVNLSVALMELGQWDEAVTVLRHGVESDGLGEPAAGILVFASALRGDPTDASTYLAEPTAGIENLQTRATADLVAAAVMAARDPERALAHARKVLEASGGIGVRHETIRWAWPLAVRLAADLGHVEVLDELIAFIDAQHPGHLPPQLRGERELAAARRADLESEVDAAAAYQDAVAALRRTDSPYRLANGLLDWADFLHRRGGPGAGDAMIEEARVLATGLGCRPLVERAQMLASRVAASH
ncbi:MAG TPA: adenylate/guanylate cyclase domain-containing protein [Acidimicrobiales bacterium]|nr:adenylate/guanylate cyclase domain-containing protein [Acidimicrobiales bacterium]